jgi:hypothetical protein
MRKSFFCRTAGYDSGDENQRGVADMIDRIKIEGFRCLQEIDVQTKPLTVLIGPNDSGKSAFLGGIAHLLRNGGAIGGLNLWRGDPNMPGGVLMDFHGGSVFANKVNYQYTGDARDVQPLSWFHLPAQGVAMTCEGFNDEAGPPEIGPNGMWVPALFDYLLRRDRDRFFGARDALKAFIPGLDDVHIATPGANMRRIDLVIEKRRSCASRSHKRRATTLSASSRQWTLTTTR